MPALALARLVLLDIRRGGLPWLAAGCVAMSLAIAAFLSEVALTENRGLQAAVVAALLRASAVFLLAAQVVASTVREINDKAFDLMLALPLSRATHFLGRLLGYAVCSSAVALAFAMPNLLWSTPQAVGLWAVSLALECTLVSAVALFFSVTLTQVVAAAAATAGWYLLARSIGAIQAIAAGPLAIPSLAHEAGRWGIDAVAFVLPRLDAVTQTGWLLYAPPPMSAYLAGLGSALVYLLLVVAAGLFDLYRRSV